MYNTTKIHFENRGIHCPDLIAGVISNLSSFKSEDRLLFNFFSCWDFEPYLHNFSALFSRPGRPA